MFYPNIIYRSSFLCMNNFSHYIAVENNKKKKYIYCVHMSVCLPVCRLLLLLLLFSVENNSSSSSNSSGCSSSQQPHPWYIHHTCTDTLCTYKNKIDYTVNVSFDKCIFVIVLYWNLWSQNNSVKENTEEKKWKKHILCVSVVNLMALRNVCALVSMVSFSLFQNEFHFVVKIFIWLQSAKVK